MPRNGAVDLSDGGFLVDPLQTTFWRPAAPPVALPDLKNYRALGLLGEPGIGKSTVLEAEAARLAAESSEENAMSIHVNLRAYSSESLLVQRVFESPRISAWKTGTMHLFLHLDSLDESLLRIDSIANLIASELPHLPTERMSLRIACRTAVWPDHTLEPALTRIWGEEAVGVFELAPLRRVDVITAAEDRGIDPKAFIEALYVASVVPFAIKPLTLSLLLSLFQYGGTLPRSIAELYLLGCRKLCEEQNPSRRDARKLGRLNPDQRLRLAGRLAAVTMFANRYAVWTGTETDIFPESDVPLSKLSSGYEEGEFLTFPSDEANIREVLDTGLFTARGPTRMGWAHQSYAEFLAAHYLIAKGVPSRNVLKLFVHPSGGLVPQLSTVAAWAASLSKEIRKGLISQEPLALFKGDLFNWDAEDLSLLIDSLLIAYERKTINDFLPGIGYAYSKLAHPGLAAQLRPYIADPTKDVQARRTACSIAEACELKALQLDLLPVALDPSDDTSVRARAVSALGRCGDDLVAEQLLPLAKGELGHDQMDDVKGKALDVLWPKHVSAAELFSILTPPNEGNFGAYAMFLTETLPESLSAADLLPALHWSTAFINAPRVHHHDFHRKTLSDRILVQSWGSFERPDLTRPFVEHVFSRLKDGGELFKGTDDRRQKAFFDDLDSKVAKRRAFLVAASRVGFGQFETFGLIRARLLKGPDFDWLLSISPVGAAPIVDIDAETLCNMIQSTSILTMLHNSKRCIPSRPSGSRSDDDISAYWRASPSIPPRRAKRERTSD